MGSFRESKQEGDWSPRALGAVSGSIAAVLLYLLSAIFLVLTTNKPLGTTRPFTTLSGGVAVFAPKAIVWTLLDAHWAYPSVVVGTSRIYRDTLEILANRGDGFAVLLRTIPPLLLVVAGAVTATLLRRKTSNDYGLYGGAVIAIGYTPLILVPGLLARVPVAPNASGRVDIGGTVFDASELSGVYAHPNFLLTIFVALYYPTVFGAIGAWLSTLPRRFIR